MKLSHPKYLSIGFAAVFGVLLATVPLAKAQGTSFDSLKSTIAAIASKKPGNSTVSVAVVDVVSGEVIFESNGKTILNPASNAKIVTAACALKTLGPEFRFSTSLHGKQDGVSIRGPLYIKGHGDPSLSTRDLWDMVQELKEDGIRRIEGGVVVDDSYFDGNNLPFAYDQQPNEDNKFRAPVGAVSLNHNALRISVRPGATAFVKARVSFDPPGYAIVTNDTVTVGQGAHNPKISATSAEDRTKVRVWGTVPLGARPVSYFRRIDNPSLFAGYGLKEVLKESGISVAGEVRIGQIPAGTPLVAYHSSKPLSSLLLETGKMSNNFVTETILKTIGAEAVEGPGTWSGAIEAASKVLSEWGLEAGSYEYRNGSGLFDANKFSTLQFTKILRAAYLDAGIRPEFLAQLATGGVDGTIKSRYRNAAALRKVRAKTGTLSDVSALSGYVLDEKGTHPIAFSILVNKAPGYVSVARGYQEKIVTAIAEYLNP